MPFLVEIRRNLRVWACFRPKKWSKIELEGRIKAPWDRLSLYFDVVLLKIKSNASKILKNAIFGRNSTKFACLRLFQAKKVVKNRASGSYKSSLRSSESIFWRGVTQNIVWCLKTVKKTCFSVIFSYFYRFKNIQSFYSKKARVRRSLEGRFALEIVWSSRRFFSFVEKWFSPPKVTFKPLWIKYFQRFIVNLRKILSTFGENFPSFWRIIRNNLRAAGS